MTDRPTSTKPRTPGAEQVDASSTYPSTFARGTPHEVARDHGLMHEQLVEMRGSVSWNHLDGRWHASASLPHNEFGATSGCYTSAETPETAVAESHAEWVKLGKPTSETTDEHRERVERWAREREENQKRGAALRDLQTGSGECCGMPTGVGAAAPGSSPGHRDQAPAAGEEAICFGDALCWNERCPTHGAVSDAEAEAVADSACGPPVESATSRVYVGKGPERLAKRFPIGGRRG